jgi:hypothetical protein
VAVHMRRGAIPAQTRSSLSLLSSLAPLYSLLN